LRRSHATAPQAAILTRNTCRARSNPERENRLIDSIACGVLAAVSILALLSFRDYGLSWDDYTHSEYGELLVRLYASGFSDRRALSWVNLYYYGGGFDLLSAVVSKVVPFSLFETRRLMGAAVGILALFATWRIARRIDGSLAGLVALALLASCPLYYGHMFMNPKDPPFAAAMAILLWSLVALLERYPTVTVRSGAFVGLGLGLSFGSRILAGFAVLAMVGALVLLFVAEARQKGIAVASSRLRFFTLRLLPALALGYCVMGLVWPWSVIDPLNPFRAVVYFSRFFEKPWTELFAGAAIAVIDMPRSYVPTLLALKLPEIFIALATLGAAGAFATTFRKAVVPPRRAIHLLILLAAFLPLVVVVAVRPAMYNGVRHFLFVLPPLAVLGGLAGASIYSFSNRSALVSLLGGIALIVGLAMPVIEMSKLHPYEYTYFNWASGGVRHERNRYMLDYWGLSLKQASEGLLNVLRARGETKPEQRLWNIAVCGPQRSPEVELGADFGKPTWDPQGADYAMTLGEFYCRELDAPVLVEVARDGVTYARVYDIRGRSYDTLLTRPGL
jgi:hypothetical protein